MDRDHPAPKSFDPAHSDAPPLPAASPGGGLVLLVATAAAEHRDWAERSAAALASAWARQGHRILLADLGLLHPALHTILGIPNDEGLTDSFLFGSSVQKVARPIGNGEFLFVPAGTATGRPEAVTESPRWTSVIEGCARVQATLVVYLPSDLPGRDTMLVHATDVVQLGEANGSGATALPAGLSDLIRAVLVPPGSSDAPAPAPDDGMGDFHFEEPPVTEPAPGAVAPEATPADDLFASLPSNSFGLGAETTETFSDSDLLFALPDAADEDLAADAPASGRLAFVAPEPEPEPAPAPPPPRAAMTAAPMAPLATHGAAMEDFARRDEPPPPRPAPRRPASDERRPRSAAKGKPAASKAWQPLVLLLFVLLIAAAAAARLGVVEIPFLSDWVGASRADASPPPGAVVTAAPAPPPALEPLATSLTLDSFTSSRVARVQADALNERRPDILAVVAPVQVNGTTYHRLLVGPTGDSAGIAALRDTLATFLTSENPASWVARPTPLAFLVGERDDLAGARDRVTELSRVDIPAYVVEVPARTASGARRSPFRVYVGAYADEVEAAYFRNVLVAKGFPDSRLLERIGQRPE